MVPLPGRAIPRASVRQFILLAVNIPEQEPQVGQALSSHSNSSASLIIPLLWAPTASKTVVKSIAPPLPGTLPANIAPPETTMVGILIRAAAINIAGTILSQLGTITKASKGWAIAITSIESAISSRLASEYFIPLCPIAKPSHTPITENSMGVPPALLTPALTASTILSRWTWPGMIVLAELTIPIKGEAISRSLNPNAFRSERWGARLAPLFISSLLIFWPHSLPI